MKSEPTWRSACVARLNLLRSKLEPPTIAMIWPVRLSIASSGAFEQRRLLERGGAVRVVLVDVASFDLDEIAAAARARGVVLRVHAKPFLSDRAGSRRRATRIAAPRSTSVDDGRDDVAVRERARPASGA